MVPSSQTPTIYWRSRILYVVLALFGAIFFLRLGYIQILQNKHYQVIAQEEHEKKFAVPSERGEIYLKDGDKQVPLVLNETVFTVFADPRFIENVDSTAASIAEVIGGNISDYKAKLSDKDTAYTVLGRRISREKALILEEKQLKGVGLQEGSQRVYPEGNLANQILGFVNDEGNGQYGIEEYLNTELKGKDGLLKAITDVRGVPLPTGEDNIVRPPEKGADIILTIDRNIQRAVQDALKKGVENSKGDSGSAIVMDPNTGAIKAMANYPDYEPAKYGDVPQDKYSVFQNATVNESYEAGSVVKVFTMASGLNERAVTKDMTYYDSGSVEVDGWKIENAGGSGGKTRTMLDVISHSVNTGVVFVLKQLGGGEINEKSRNILYDYFTRKFGLGSNTGIEQADEDPGVINGPNTGEGDNIRYANMTFGQGMRTTMVQMAAAFSSLINGGTYYKPYLVESKTINDKTNYIEPQSLRPDLISADAQNQLKDMMREVMVVGGGYKARRAGYILGGKTGTAQIPDENGQYTKKEEIGSFIGYGAGKTPQYVIMTRVNKPKIAGYAGTEAASPIFADISDYLIGYYKIAPVE
ncbi:penicillin-binding protein 2 [Candidatus Saccharibacteria bacterium CPR2]|nr:penicillin-binding protein 2 [Candidatus Saccharibacteria bacterium CPR2]